MLKKLEVIFTVIVINLLLSPVILAEILFPTK